jgi:hypothetical protein
VLPRGKLALRFIGPFKILEKRGEVVYQLELLPQLSDVHDVFESASRPHSGFWCLNDKTIKELMTFAKCETGKMSYKIH